MSDQSKAMASKSESGASSGGFFSNTAQYLSDVRGETRKVTWPQRKEAVAGTIGVVVVAAFVSVVLGVIDAVLAQAVKWVMP